MLISSLTMKEECKNRNCWRNSCYLHVVSYQFLCGAGWPWPAGCVYTDFLWERKEGRGVREGESRKTRPLPRNSSPGHLPPLGCRAYNILMQTHVYAHDQVRAHKIREYCSWNRIHLRASWLFWNMTIFIPKTFNISKKIKQLLQCRYMLKHC